MYHHVDPERDKTVTTCYTIYQHSSIVLVVEALDLLFLLYLDRIQFRLRSLLASKAFSFYRKEPKYTQRPYYLYVKKILHI